MAEEAGAAAPGIPALVPRGAGHQFALYADSCSGVPGAPHEANLAAINAVVRRLEPQPEFILFPGDEIIGLTADEAALRAQWRHFLDREMAWLDRGRTPIWHTTGNHTTYDAMSEAVFRETLAMPDNGPPGQEGLSYVVRRGDLFMAFVNTAWSGMGGEGHVETDWLRSALAANGDASHRLVIGHHPVFPVNGFSGPYQRQIGAEYAQAFWDILVENGVAAYLCSHILAFDVQVHRGVLQLCTAGAGTAHRMPDGIEYLHCVQAAIDGAGLRYQVLDMEGRVREGLEWPMPAAAGAGWRALEHGEQPAPVRGRAAGGGIVELRFSGRAAAAGEGAAQTLVSAHEPGVAAPFWLGLRGPAGTLTLVFGPAPGRSPHYWLGPAIGPGAEFDFHVAVNPAMGPGGVLFRRRDDPRWTSLAAASATGLEDFDWPSAWSVCHGQGGPDDRPFAGAMRDVQLRY